MSARIGEASACTISRPGRCRPRRRREPCARGPGATARRPSAAGCGGARSDPAGSRAARGPRDRRIARSTCASRLAPLAPVVDDAEREPRQHRPDRRLRVDPRAAPHRARRGPTPPRAASRDRAPGRPGPARHRRARGPASRAADEHLEPVALPTSRHRQTSVPHRHEQGNQGAGARPFPTAPRCTPRAPGSCRAARCPEVWAKAVSNTGDTR
jgi:hypothetical protein